MLDRGGVVNALRKHPEFKKHYHAVYNDHVHFVGVVYEAFNKLLLSMIGDRSSVWPNREVTFSPLPSPSVSPSLSMPAP